MRSALRTAALALSASLAFALPATAEVQLSLRNGRVTLITRDATVRQILAEWARVGKTKIVNAERIPGGPLTLELKDVPEAEALDVLLRTLSGYIAAPRATLAPADASVYDSIAVMPTIASAAPRTAATSGAPAPFSPPPAFNPTPEDDQDNPQQRPGNPQGARPPIFSTFPTPQQGNPNGNGARPVLPVVRPGAIAQPRAEPNVNTNVNEAPGPIVPSQPPPSSPTAAPGGLTGVSAPGMMPPAASQPGQIVQPQR
jgi:hypothetical protein